MKDNKKFVVASVWFAVPGGKRYDKYLAWSDVWKYSAHNVFGISAELISQEHEPPDMTEPCHVFMRGNRKIGPSKTLAFRKKIKLWNEIVKSVPVGVPILLTDIDVAFYKNPFHDVFDEIKNWDIGRTGYNTGTIYLSGSEESHSFMQCWNETNEEMFANKKLYQEYDRKYKGLDQGSFGLLLERGDHPANVLTFPAKYHSTYHNFQLPCYIMHYHSVMSSAIFGNRNNSAFKQELLPYVDAWIEMLQKARNK